MWVCIGVSVWFQCVAPLGQSARTAHDRVGWSLSLVWGHTEIEARSCKTVCVHMLASADRTVRVCISFTVFDHFTKRAVRDFCFGLCIIRVFNEGDWTVKAQTIYVFRTQISSHLLIFFLWCIRYSLFTWPFDSSKSIWFCFFFFFCKWWSLIENFI